MDLNRYYLSIADAVPESVRKRLDQQREQIETLIRDEVQGFAAQLGKDIEAQLGAIAAELDAERKKTELFRQELETALVQAQPTAEALRAAGRRLADLQAAHEQRVRSWGAMLRSGVTGVAQRFGIPV